MVLVVRRLGSGLLLALFLALVAGVGSPVWAANTQPYGPVVDLPGGSHYDLVVKCGQVGTETPLDSCTSFLFDLSYGPTTAYSSRFVLTKYNIRDLACYPYSCTYAQLFPSAEAGRYLQGASATTLASGGSRSANVATTDNGWRYAFEYTYKGTGTAQALPNVVVDMTSSAPGATATPTPTPSPTGSTTVNVDTCGDTKDEPCFQTMDSGEQSYTSLVVLGALVLLLLSGILAAQLRRP